METNIVSMNKRKLADLTSSSPSSSGKLPKEEASQTPNHDKFSSDLYEFIDKMGIKGYLIVSK